MRGARDDVWVRGSAGGPADGHLLGPTADDLTLVQRSVGLLRDKVVPRYALELRGSGDGVCLQCHAAAKYETADHNFHGQVSPPVPCISCHHMPTKT
jgi:hypothetical protein